MKKLNLQFIHKQFKNIKEAISNDNKRKKSQKRSKSIWFTSANSISILEKNFEPYSIQYQKIQDEKQKKELVAKETCAREGHTGEWHEHEYTVWAICGDRGFERYCPITKKNWTRICTRCREQETVDVEPIEVTRLHKLQEINDMEEKLKQMKSE